jgi:hypothetical protein
MLGAWCQKPDPLPANISNPISSAIPMMAHTTGCAPAGTTGMMSALMIQKAIDATTTNIRNQINHEKSIK